MLKSFVMKLWLTRLGKLKRTKRSRDPIHSHTFRKTAIETDGYQHSIALYRKLLGLLTQYNKTIEYMLIKKKLG